MTKHADRIVFYGRFADDVHAVLDGSVSDAEAHVMLAELRADDPKLNAVPWELSRDTAVFLDLTSTVTGVHESFVITTKVHQKALNRYDYLPTASYHRRASVTAWLVCELRRYVRLCSHEEDYVAIRDLFESRLLRRAYGVPVIHAAIDEVHYSERQHYILQALGAYRPAPAATRRPHLTLFL